MQLLAAGCGGANVLHDSRKSFQLRGWRVHAQYRPCTGARKRNGTDIEDDVRSGLCEAGRGSEHSAAGEGSEGDCVFATGGYACGPGRGAVCIATGGRDVAARGGRARGSWYRSAVAGPSDMYGTARVGAVRCNREPWMHWESRLYRAG